MGQKVNPHGIRVGVIKDWDSRWFEMCIRDRWNTFPRQRSYSSAKRAEPMFGFDLLICFRENCHAVHRFL